jgi:cytochrome oxidase Cu insertion factor (SCO1/SenC/PrrC family)
MWSRSDRGIWVGLALMVLGALAGFLLLRPRGVGPNTTDAQAPRPGDPAPSFTLPSAQGQNVSLHQFQGRPVLLYFSMGPG